MKKHNIFAKADEKFVKSVVLYADSNKKLYYDEAAKTDKVKAEDMLDLFQKGVVVFLSDKYYAPCMYSSAGYTCNDGTSTAVVFTGEA